MAITARVLHAEHCRVSQLRIQVLQYLGDFVVPDGINEAIPVVVAQARGASSLDLTAHANLVTLAEDIQYLNLHARKPGHCLRQESGDHSFRAMVYPSERKPAHALRSEEHT